MTPASRRPRGKQNKQGKRSSVRRAALTVVPDEPCDCPACSGQDVDPAVMVDDIIKGVATMTGGDDPLDAELAGAAFTAMVTIAGNELGSVVIQELIPQIEERGDSSALAILLAIGSVGSALRESSGPRESVVQAASAAAGRLVAAGTPEPQWAAELAEPVRVGDCVRLTSSDESASVLVASFRRAGRGHAFVILTDELDCGAAMDILPVRADDLPGVLDDLHQGARADGLEFATQAVDPAEWRWYAEQALDARAVHDEQDSQDPLVEMLDEADEDDEDEGLPYPVLAQLVRARLSAMPPARRPANARSHEEAHSTDGAMLDMLTSLAQITGGFGGPQWGRPGKLPAKRKKPDGPAPIYQVKVGLRGAKPPIWRRLLVPGDIGLARLHGVIQTAFGWNDSHMHVFETPYGDFGQADRELGYRSEAPVTLEQVVQREKDKITYRYDFGDDWEHEILVEKVLDRDPALTYPCCVGGRRAAPPDDCGGVWGYAELVEILADPRHPQHRERLDWLGLDDPSQFDPAAFDVDTVNAALRGRRGRRPRA